MQRVTMFATAVLLVLVSACSGSKRATANTQCTSADDCADGCANLGYENYTCSTDGLCLCNEIHEDRGCDLDQECETLCSDEGADRFSCSGGKCVCSELPPVQCVEDVNCEATCGECESSCGEDGVCYCFCPGAEVNTVTISTRNYTGSPQIDQMNAEVSSFQLAIDSISDVRMDAVTLTQGGSLASNKLVNCSLFRGADQIATSSGFSGDSLTFALDTPYVVAAGRTRTFYVYCDIEGGSMIDTIRLYLHQASDLDVTDIAREQPARVVNQLTLEDVIPLTLRGPMVTVVDNGPVSSLVLPGTVNVRMQDLSLSASHDVTVRDTRIIVRVYDASGQPVGTADESAYDLLRNLRMVDLDTGSTLLGPLTMVSSGDRVEQAGEVWYSKVHTNDYELTGGETRHLSIQLDVESGFPAGYSIMVEHWLTPEVGTESYIKYMPSNEFLPASNITGNPVFSRRVVVTDYPSLNVTRAAAPVSGTYVKGEPRASVLGVYLSAGTDDITTNRLIVRFYGNDNITWNSVRGNLAANTIVASAMLYDGAELIAGPEALSLVDVVGSNGIYDTGDYYRVFFDDLALTVPAGTTRTLTVKVNLLNTMSATVYLAADVVPDLDVIAWDTGVNTVIPSGIALNGGLPHEPLLTVLTRG